ncbi:transport protein AbrB [Escherichia coli]|nr:transport protein AbrB [Escherichia coli]
MPVLQWGMLCVLSLLLSIGFLAVHLPAALLLGPMIAGIISVCAELLCNFPAPLFSPPRPSWLHDCAKPHWFDSHHAGRQLADRACYFTGDAAFQRHRGLVIGAL